MAEARVFKSGNSQALRLPKEFRFESDRVEIFRRGDEIVLRELRPSAVDIFDTLAALSLSTLERKDSPPQVREEL
ncbi:virulence factor [Pseudomonas oryzihabitans]|uniref:antitoxin n=1 Tax=Pseudomonas rhizoryzae TaxID=2571129 RepID=UPI0007378334|nr:type II toxin-antitoxin system VapB family antitoxin [Pseudomonas rhizoryzae]APQ12119.1 antitoxin [Pseudomonas psychrotolerans]KTS78350.1 virulence factor [Pseudomonas psychrotolerans]KTS93573.1 virulence factor [Pseudomonas psychrotolerans]KTT13337.1 virulence factor [Pseudomonas psychrotolerans]KTT20813.1 virulence factor [Pseudomonas psychrotolerans]